MLFKSFVAGVHNSNHHYSEFYGAVGALRGLADASLQNMRNCVENDVADTGLHSDS